MGTIELEIKGKKATNFSVKPARGKDGAIRIDETDWLPRVHEGVMDPKDVQDLIVKNESFVFGGLDEVNTFIAIGKVPIGILAGEPIVPGRTKTGTPIACENTGLRLIRDVKHIPASIEEAQCLFVPLDENTMEFKPNPYFAFLAGRRGVQGMNLGKEKCLVCASPNPSTICPRIELAILGTTPDFRKIRDAYQGEGNLINWYLKKSSSDFLSDFLLVGQCNDQGSFSPKSKEISVGSYLNVPDELRGGDQMAQPLIELIQSLAGYAD